MKTTYLQVARGPARSHASVNVRLQHVVTQLQSFVAVQRRLEARQTERYRGVSESVVAQELCRFPLVSSHQPFPERRMEEHVRVVQAFHEKTREHLIEEKRKVFLR